MGFSIFDENFYLDSYPDVAAAVTAGVFSSGLEHFQHFGLKEGRVLVAPFYNEGAYLSGNSDVVAAVQQGIFSSGLQHFILHGEAEGRTQISSRWSEEAYLGLNQDVAAAVQQGIFSSGLQHFLSFGKSEDRIGAFGIDTFFQAGTIRNFNLSEDQIYLPGREGFPPSYYKFELMENGDFNIYRQRYFTGTNFTYDLITVVEGIGVPLLPTDPDPTTSGFFLEASSLEKTGFNESAYLVQNPDVAEAVEAKIFPSGLEHYVQFGQTEGRSAFFTGSSQSDTVVAFGQLTNLTGVEGGVTDTGTFVPTSVGRDENDILRGSSGTDRFILGVFNPDLQESQGFYLGSGYAQIENFDESKDRIVLAGKREDYNIHSDVFAQHPSLYRSYISYGSDLIAYVSNAPSLGPDNLEFIG